LLAVARRDDRTQFKSIYFEVAQGLESFLAVLVRLEVNPSQTSEVLALKGLTHAQETHFNLLLQLFQHLKLADFLWNLVQIQSPLIRVKPIERRLDYVRIQLFKVNLSLWNLKTNVRN